MIKIICIMVAVIGLVGSCFAAQYDYQCGNSENGCDPHDIKYTCLCVQSHPTSSVKQGPSVCLNLKVGACEPMLPRLHRCAEGSIVAINEATCLALLWQSEPDPICRKISAVSKHLCGYKCTRLEHCQAVQITQLFDNDLKIDHL